MRTVGGCLIAIGGVVVLRFVLTVVMNELSQGLFKHPNPMGPPWLSLRLAGAGFAAVLVGLLLRSA